MSCPVERYKASMILSGVGDALGYANGEWEFCMEGEHIHKELKKMGGLEKVSISAPKWNVSDDTVMHLAVGEALVEFGSNENRTMLWSIIGRKYQESMRDMSGRAPGATSMTYTHKLRPDAEGGCFIPFNSRGGGCGAAMRAMCIGLRYPRPDQIDDLIAVSCESGRMTHHHPTGYLGAMAAALFTSFSVQQRPVKEWGAALLQVLPKALQYIESEGRDVEDNKSAWAYFTDAWKNYLTLRGILDGNSDPQFPASYGVKERDIFYKSLSFAGWGGASGHDAPMIAYDALLGSGDNWEELCKRGMLHGGDNDSTGVIAGACYGAMYGLDKVFPKNYQKLQYRERLENIAVELYKLSQSEADQSPQPTEGSRGSDSAKV